MFGRVLGFLGGTVHSRARYCSHDDHIGGEQSAFVHSHISFYAPEIEESTQTTVRQSRDGGEHQLSIFDFQKQSPPRQSSLTTSAVPVPELLVRDFHPDDPEPVDYQHWEINYKKHNN